MLSQASILLLSTLAALGSVNALPATRSVAPVEFTMSLPDYFCANSRQTLYWRGGNGEYTVTSTLHYQGSDAQDKVTELMTDSTSRRYEVGIGRIGSEFPTGSTYSFEVYDPTSDSAVTAAVPIYSC